MGRNKRRIPARLGAKLKAIRRSLNLSQTGMLKMLMPHADASNRALISGYERATKAPDYPVLLKYTKARKVSTDVLLDDQQKLDSNEKSPPVSSHLKDQSGSSGTDIYSDQPIDFSSLPDTAEEEEIMIAVNSKVLDCCDDLYLDLLRQTPRRMRPFLTREKFYESLLIAAAADFKKDKQENSLAEHWKRWQAIFIMQTEENQ